MNVRELIEALSKENPELRVDILLSNDAEKGIPLAFTQYRTGSHLEENGPYLMLKGTADDYDNIEGIDLDVPEEIACQRCGFLVTKCPKCKEDLY
jgi:hypothetical protein